MTKNKFLDDLINRLEESSKNDRGINLKAEFKGFDDSEFEFLKENIDEVIERIKTFAKEAYEHLDMTVDDVPESLRDEIYEDGERAGYEQGSYVGEKVKVPAYVGEWIEENITDTDVSAAIIVFNGTWVVDDLDLKVENWVNHGKGSQMKLLKAIVNGYEIEEEEKLYRIYEPTTERYLTFSAGHYVWFSGKHDDVKQQFTEQEIKNLDERLWSFAVEVTE